MKKLVLAYFGTPLFAASFLEKILADKTLPVELKLVVTQPDRPVGKKQVLTASPVKLVAQKFKNLKIENSLKIENLKLKIKSADLALVCAYGQIIPKELLTLPKYGFWNIHYSLLPKYRGAPPVACALIAGEKKTGVTIFQMDEKIDHGPIIVQEELEISPDDRRPDLEVKLTDLAFEMFKKIIKTGVGAPFSTTNQNHSLATYTKKLTKQDGLIPFENLIPPLAGKNSPEIIFNLFRGLYPWPGIWTTVKIKGKSKRLKITDLEIIQIDRSVYLKIKKVQLEGKKDVDFEIFNRAYKVF